MLVIRLARKGRRNRPTYRITVAEHSKPTDGKFVEVVGHYDPVASNQPLEVNKERVDYWMSKGAQVSNTMAKLLNRTGYTLPVIEKNKPSKKKEEKKEEKPVSEGEKSADAKEASPKEDDIKKEEKPATEDIPKEKEVVKEEKKEEEPKPEESSEDKPTE